MVKFRKYKNYSGPVILGTKRTQTPSLSWCVARQHWLAAKVETGATYDSVVMYDGTGITAGPDQFILVYPKELAHEDFNAKDDQGPLVKLLRRLEPVPGLAGPVAALWELFASIGVYVSQSGHIRHLEAETVRIGRRKCKVRAGDLVNGSVLRDRVTPVNGTVPRRGPEWERASSICTAVHNLFAHEAGFSVQNAFGEERLLKTYSRLKLHRWHSDTSVGDFVYGSQDPSIMEVGHVGEPLDLAMAVWYSNSVNAPAIALRKLIRCGKAAVSQPQADRIVGGANRDEFAKTLIRALGTSTYGRWNANEPNGRYQRTRKWAMRSGLWDLSLFRGKGAVMPAKL
jgi:hypothetical protein